MDSVLNRPLFRRRDARDRLNDVAGVQKFAPGGPVSFDSSGAIVRDMRQPSIAPMGTIPRVIERPTGGMVPIRSAMSDFTRVDLPPGDGPAGEFLYNPATGEVRMPDGSRIVQPGYEETVSRKIQAYMSSGGPRGEEVSALKSGIAGLVAQSEEAARQGFVGESQELAETALGLRQRLGGIPEQGPTTAKVMDRGVFALEGPESVPQETLDIFNELGRAAENAVPLAPGGNKTPSPAPGTPKPLGTFARPAGPAAGMPAAAPAAAPAAPLEPSGPSGMEMEARGRGPMATNPAAVAAGLNDPNPEVRDKTVADFMKEFTENAPKYEGGDKRLMHAMIGFAIAAGESPNAMTNIARGLQAGAEMMLKDKAAKDEFDRQIQLSAMQYGLQETSKLAAEKRLLEREGMKGDFFVDQDGNSVFVNYDTLWKTGLPEGLQTESMADASAKAVAGMQKALLDAENAKKLSVSDFRALSKELNEAAESFDSARSLRPLLEASIIRAADGKVTGFNALLTDWVNQAANLAGIDLGKEWEDPAQFDKDMLTVTNRLIQEILRESGRTVSDEDRERAAKMVGQLVTMQARGTTDPDVLVSALQNVLSIIDENEQAALDTYRTITNATMGLYAPSGGPLELSQRARRTFEEPASIDMGGLFDYDASTGVWKPKVQ